jgi:hypothetical protein
MGRNFSDSKSKRKNKSKKRNGETVTRRKESSNSIRKRKAVLPHKLNEYQVELYRSVRSKTESETSERISNSPKEMVKLYEKTDFESERDNRNLSSTSSLPSPNKEVQIQKYIDKNRQYSSDVQHQQEIRSNEPIPRKIWKLSERNYLILKSVHILGRINVAMDKLSCLEMSGDYQLNKVVFQRIQKMW